MILTVLVGCEESGIVRDAFRELGHDAWSCDLLPCSGNPEYHLQMDVFEAIKLKKWDLCIFHPPCQYMAISGARWLYNKDGSINQERKDNQDKALDFVRRLLAVNVPHICLENPVSTISSRIRKPDDIIQPWQHGHPEKKKTCLWLKNLPKLKVTDLVYVDMIGLPKSWTDRIHYMSPGEDRAKLRSKSYTGIAKAMAQQYSEYIINEKTSKS